MLTIEEVKNIGLNACIDKIGYEFCKKHEDTILYGYGQYEGKLRCYVGVDDQPEPNYENMKPEDFFLSCGRNRLPYYVHCNVNMQNGAVEFVEWKLPPG